MECEVCGAPDAPFVSLIEGAKLHTCARCAHMGKILMRQGPSSSPAQAGEMMPAHSAMRSAAPEWELVEGFGDTIRIARMRMKLPLSVLAERLAEKESFLERVEGEKTHPSVEMARKIEKELNIHILEQGEGESGGGSLLDSLKKGSGGRTLGDIVEIEQKKKKK